MATVTVANKNVLLLSKPINQWPGESERPQRLRLGREYNPVDGWRGRRENGRKRKEGNHGRQGRKAPHTFPCSYRFLSVLLKTNKQNVCNRSFLGGITPWSSWKWCRRAVGNEKVKGQAPSGSLSKGVENSRPATFRDVHKHKLIILCIGAGERSDFSRDW